MDNSASVIIKYVKLEDVLKYLPDNGDLTGYKPSYLRKVYSELPTLDVTAYVQDLEKGRG